MQKNINLKLFIPCVVILSVLLIVVTVNLSAVQASVNAAYDFCISKFGWLFVIANLSCLIFSLWIMFGPYKNIKLGGDDAKPTFRTISWAGMMFTTSCGAWLVVYGFLEPLYCISQDAIPVDALSTKAYEYGQMYAHFHWGPNAWCIYVPASIAISYLIYNRGVTKNSIGTACSAILGKSKKGKAVEFLADIFSVCGSVIAPVISIGTGMPLLVALIETIFNVPDTNRMTIQAVVLIIWIAIFGTSVYRGLSKGIQKLSNTNIWLYFIFAAIFLFAGGVFRAISSEVNSFGLFLQNYIRMSTYTDPFGSGSFVKGWTIGYWACYFVYMPLMGVFNAKISKGRRLKEVAFGQLVLCTLGSWVSMATFGNYAMKLQMSDIINISAFLDKGDEAGAIIAIVKTMPASKLFMIGLLIIAFIFLATTMDSSAFSAAEMTANQENGESLAPRWLRLLWAAIAALVAFTLCQVGGVKAVRSLCYMTGLPLAIIAFVLIASSVKMLREDHAEECEGEKRIKLFDKV